MYDHSQRTTADRTEGVESPLPAPPNKSPTPSTPIPIPGRSSPFKATCRAECTVTTRKAFGSLRTPSPESQAQEAAMR